MEDAPIIPRSFIRLAENTELSLGSLEAIAQIRKILDRLEGAALKSAKDKGATIEDIAEALGLTTQAIYYRLRRQDGQPLRKRGRPRAADPA